MKFYVNNPEVKTWAELTKGQKTGFIVGTSLFVISIGLQIHELVTTIRENRKFLRDLEQSTAELKENLSKINFFGDQPDDESEEIRVPKTFQGLDREYSDFDSSLDAFRARAKEKREARDGVHAPLMGTEEHPPSIIPDSIQNKKPCV